MKKLIPLIILIAGCANDPIVDRRGHIEAEYEKDLAECRTYADEVSTLGEAAEHGAIGAVVGSVFGAVIGNSDAAGRGAGAGAVSGGTSGAVGAETRKERILYRCLKGRGYKVLG
jgi:outer membrane lipoprotein SlyB